MLNRLMSCLVALMPLVAAAPAAAQQYMHREDLPMHERQRLEGEKRSKEAADAKYGQQQQAERDRQRSALLKKPPIPAESNGLLGSWRLGDGQRSSLGGLGRETGSGGLGGIVEMLSSMRLDKMTCEAGFSGGITFAPSTYSGAGIAGKVGGPIAYRSGRSRDKQVTVAIPSAGGGDMMVFEVATPNRIVDENGCVLVRVGALEANAAPTVPGNTRAGAAGLSAPPAAGAMPEVASVVPAPPPSTLSRPSPEVCRNRLLDKLGAVGVHEVRAMSEVRFKQAPIEGHVPNTKNLRLGLRGSACDDPRITATLYDFNRHGLLQSITFLWDRPAGPAPAPIYSERATHLSRVFSLAPPQSPVILQADTSAGRLTLQDMPERNLLLEAYAAKQ
jgi:hypothetical protein